MVVGEWGDTGSRKVQGDGFVRGLIPFLCSSWRELIWAVDGMLWCGTQMRCRETAAKHRCLKGLVLTGASSYQRGLCGNGLWALAIGKDRFGDVSYLTKMLALSTLTTCTSSYPVLKLEGHWQVGKRPG